MDRKIILTAGLGSLDAYPAFAEAGADEVFLGYVPASWQERYSCLSPLNRREVHYANCQLGSESELMILRKMQERLGVPTVLAFNALSYAPEQLPRVGRILRDCLSLGFDRFIIADIGLLLWLDEQKKTDPVLRSARILISGELGEITPPLTEELRRLGAERIIFPRKMSFESMRACIEADRKRHPEAPLAWEMFLFNENCAFSGCFCNSLHCDQLPYACRLPRQLPGQSLPSEKETDPSLPGSSGCGLCALHKARQMGITHFKIVGRGALPEGMIRDIRLCRRAAKITESCGSEEDYRRRMKDALFPKGCSGSCYYPAQEA